MIAPFRSAVAIVVALAASASAQPQAPTERVTFDDAVKRAIERNPSSAVAAAGILRAEALLVEARAATRLQVNGAVTTTTLNKGVEFAGETVTPRNSLLANLDARVPIFAEATWALTTHARGMRHITK